jgi:hypothetical protein
LNSSCKSKNFYNFYKVQYFYKDGYLKEEYILTEKGRLGRIYYKNGQLMAEGNMIENPSWYIKVGRWNYYSEEGELQDIKIDYTYKEYPLSLNSAPIAKFSEEKSFFLNIAIKEESLIPSNCSLISFTSPAFFCKFFTPAFNRFLNILTTSYFF